MKILLISYGDFEYDGRLRELYKISKNLGEVFLISRGKEKIDTNHCILNCSYYSFVKKTVNFGNKIEGIDVLFLDNRKSIIPGLKLKKHFKEAKIVLDCRELYLSKDVKHLSGKIGCLIEKRGIKAADVIICASKERASFMKEYHNLKKEPLVFQNLRMLNYSSSKKEEISKAKFEKFNITDEFRIVSTAGCDVSRLTDVLVKNLKKVTTNCKLFLVGNSSKKDKEKIKSICIEHRVNNVIVLDALNQDDLKALISICHIGVVSYHQLDINNKLCASGKIYEFLFEGLPVVTTSNPPLKNMCNDYSVGVFSDVFYDAINKIIDNFAFYKGNVAEFIDNQSICENNKKISNELRNVLKNC